MDSLMMDSQLLLQTFLWRTERLFHDKQIVTRLGPDSYHRYTYRDFGARVRRLAAGLRANGVAPGDRVATLAWNNYRHLEAYFAVPGMQATLHTVNLRLSPEQQRFTIEKAGDTVMLLDLDQVGAAEHLVELGIGVRTFVLLCSRDEMPQTSLPGALCYEDVLDQGEPFEFPEFDENTAAAICFTSATTGDPKGVVYSHRAMVLQAMCLAMHDKLGMSESAVWLEVAPMFHCNGWNIPHTALLQGATLVLPGAHPTAPDYLDIIEDLHVTGMNAAVTIGTLMRDGVQADEAAGRHRDLSSLTLLWLGGQAPSRAVMAWFEEHYGTHVVQGYGMTECSPQVGFYSLKSTLADRPTDEIDALRQKQGLPIPLMQIQVRDAEGTELAWDGESVGDFWVRSPFTASAYLDDPRTADSMVDGWLRTGDVGCVDEDGYIVLKDRSKDLIKSGGEWISSIELENALMLHPKVAEASVVGIQDDTWLERPLACVQAADESVTVEELKAHLLAQGFLRWWVPDEIVFVAAIPKTSVGKYDKKVIRGVVNEGGPAAAAATFAAAPV